MNAKLREAIKRWDRDERSAAVGAMCRAVVNGDVPQARRLVEQSPLLDHFVPYDAAGWSELAAAAGQWEMVNFWRKRERRTRTARKQASLESLLFWATGCEYVMAEGDPVEVVKHLLAAGAAVEGNIKECSPLHRAVFANRPALVELLIQHGADLARPYATGESALQIAERNQQGRKCAKLLEQAGAPLELPKKPERPKPIRTIDLRESATKLSAGIKKAIRSFTRKHPKEVITAIALASIPHEGYVMVSFDTESFAANPWDAKYDGFAWIKFRDWRRAFEGDQLRLIDLDGKIRVRDYNEEEPLFRKMIVATLQSLHSKGAFAPINAAKGCRIGIEMTNSGWGKFWRLSKVPGTSKR
ncbi:MAG TPA: ankyrin repeat domain-containing protein [Humisphaera sp.]|nr:ankyrin repeat domain-containing protein [Humisphaera sp.]